MKSKQHISEKINAAITLHNDHHRIFLDAVSMADAKSLQGFLKLQTELRRKFAQQLIGALKIFDPQASIDVDGSFVGSLKRGWQDIKSSFAMENDFDLINQSMELDAEVMQHYTEILLEHEQDLTETLLKVINEHQTKLKSQQDAAKNLEDLM